MKVTVENKKGLNKDLKVFIDKKTISSYMIEKYEEVKNLYDKLSKFEDSRTFKNKMDLKFLRDND